MQAIINFIVANSAAIISIQQGLCVLGAAIFQMLGKPAVSKWFGTFAAFDLGRVIRWVSSMSEAKKAALKVSAASICMGLCLLGCTPSSLHPKIEQALLFEDQVHAQVKTLEGVFDAAILAVPEAQRPEWQGKLAFAEQQLGSALEAKDATLRAALAASAETVDISAVVGQIVTAVTDIISIVDAMGASKPVVANARAKAAALRNGL
jgi:hypothetical protein